MPRFLLGLVVLAAIAGCRSTRMAMPFGLMQDPAPVVLTPTASAADIVAAVNANSARVTTYQAPSATISMPESAGLPLVQASLAAERPLRFRLRATTALTGPEIDLGSNDERFWIWARRNEPPALYTGRHDRWAGSPMRGQVPIEPAMLIEAIGLVSLDPSAAYVGPIPRGDGTVELRTQSGAEQRVYFIDSQRALVREQHLYNAAGSLSASVFADRYEYDPASQASLPRRVRLSVPDAGLNLTINTGPLTLNAPIAAGGQLWTQPTLPETPVIDLTSGAAPVASTTPWDLNGVSSAYESRGVLTDRLTSPSPDAFVANPTTSSASKSTSIAATPIVSTPAYPVATSVPSDRPAPNRAGFTGLPQGGRALD